MMKLKSKKAQIIILDIVYALIIIIFALFLLFKIVETHTYNVNSKTNIEELDNVGNQIYRNIISNHRVSCYISDTQNSFILPNCLGADSGLTLDNLGVPSNYECKISNFTSISPLNECNGVVPLEQDVYKKDLTMLTRGSRVINKNEYVNKINNNTASTLFSENTVTLEVWKK